MRVGSKDMAKKILYLMKIFFMFVSFLLIFTGCYNDEDEYVPDVKVFAFYETIDSPGVKEPDAGAKVYIYYRISQSNLIDYIYQGEGLFFNESLPVIKPDEEYRIDEAGKLFFIPENVNEEVIIIIESNFYKGQFESTGFSSTVNGAGVYKVFKPNEIP